MEADPEVGCRTAIHFVSVEVAAQVLAGTQLLQAQAGQSILENQVCILLERMKLVQRCPA